MSYEKFREEFQKLDTEEGKMTENQMHSLYIRVRDNLAKTKISPRGNCMLCDQIQEQIMPCQVYICKDCAEKFLKRNTVLEVIPMKKKRDPFSLCDCCGRRENTLVEMTARFCLKCNIKWSKILKERKEEELENKWRRKWVNGASSK